VRALVRRAGPVLTLAAAAILATATATAALADPGAGRLTITAPPARSGADVVLGVQVLGTTAAGAAPTVTATDAGHRPLAATAQITAEGTAPIRTAVLLVDTSGSMGRGGIDTARRAAQEYADTAGPAVRVGLIAFADHVRVVRPPTTDRAALASGLQTLTAAGETALYDGLVAAVRLAGPGANVVVLSDGGDTASTATLAQAVAAVGAAHARVDAIAFHTGESAAGPLAQIATAGHGHVVQAGDDSLGRAFATAAARIPLDITITIRTPGAAAQLADVTLAVGGHRYAGPIAMPAAPAAPAAPAGAPVRDARSVVTVPSAPGWASPWVVGGVLAALLSLAVAALAWPVGAAESSRRRRGLALAAYRTSGPDGPPGPAQESVVAAGVLQVAERAVAASGRGGRIALRLDQAGLTVLPHEWSTLVACAIVVAALAGAITVGPWWAGGVLGVLLATVVTEAFLRIRASRRCRAFAEQLPDTLQLLASSLRSGFSLPQALAAAQESGMQPMKAELGRALAAARIGVDLEDELDAVAARMRSEEWRLAVMAIRIQRSVGGNLAEVLTTTAQTLRERSALARQVKALSAEGRLSAYILLALPLGVAAFLVAFRHDYIAPLWSTVPGLAMLVVGVLGMIIGSVWMLKVAKVEV
jgi:Flp pilus assembly protein TadB